MPENKDWHSFVASFFDSAPCQVLKELNDKVVSSQLKKSWGLIQSTLLDEISVHTSIEDNRLFVVILQKDRPYLFETLKNLLDLYGLKPEMLFHPVLLVKRNAEGIFEGLQYYDGSSTDQNYQHESLIAFTSVCSLPLSKLQKLIDDLKWHFSLIHHAIKDESPIKDSIRNIMDEQKEDEKKYFSWLLDDNFTFLGCRFVSFKEESEDELGVFKDERLSSTPHLRLNHMMSKRDFKHSSLSLKKTHVLLPINRAHRLEIFHLPVVVGREILGYHQILGFFTPKSWTYSVFNIPLIKDRVEDIFSTFSYQKDWHDGKRLMQLLNIISHNDYWYFSDHDIRTLCQQALCFHEHSLPKLLIHSDHKDHNVTILMFIGKERYNLDAKNQCIKAFESFFKGTLSSERIVVDDLPFARLILTLHSKEHLPEESIFEELYQKVETLCLSWEENLHRHLQVINRASMKYNFFPLPYQYVYPIEKAAKDLMLCDIVEDTEEATAAVSFDGKKIEFRIVTPKVPYTLDQLFQTLHYFGVEITRERSFALHNDDFFIHIYKGTTIKEIDKESFIQENVQKAIVAALTGKSDNDRFNQLFLTTPLPNEAIRLFRSFAFYLIQAKRSYNFNFMANTLNEFPQVSKCLFDIFYLRFNPNIHENEREKLVENYENSFFKMLDHVTNSNQDNLFRDVLRLIKAIVRTNYFQGKNYISYKIESNKLTFLPDPKPLYEIFVSSPLMNGIHLRSSKVARGGIRYSDRFLDFRSEVLQLVQAQDLKNAIIVPSGSKGGFVLRKDKPSRDDVVEAYKTLIRGLLDITDNQAHGIKTRPNDVVCYDDFDPYLVVAADKGTATFSDIANDLSKQYGFWLGDAFASGGSKGYDHKKLGITAKGAFVSVRHHFKSIGVDLFKDSVSVIGVGDMSGDVFGNGMLLHPTMKLLAAFNHRHIFIDPNPDPQTSFEERKRLFHTPESSWADYSSDVLSKGGRIYERSQKMLTLTPEIQKAFDLPTTITPHELIQKILSTNIDLLWFGGIGTYIQAKNEEFAGDPSNDFLRIRASQVQAKVIGEGANLGITPLARIELGLKGVLLNSDAIDNAGGVNCSDHEVNLKILFASLVESKRNEILNAVVPEIVTLILKDNFYQNIALDMMQKKSVEKHHAYCDLLKLFEQELGIKRQPLFLSEDHELREKREALTRSELAIILSYSKIYLTKLILQSPLAEEVHHDYFLRGYFPEIIQTEYPHLIHNHLLKKELLSMLLANLVINIVGPLWVFEDVHKSLKRVNLFLNQLMRDGADKYLKELDLFDYDYQAIHKKLAFLHDTIDQCA